MSIITLNRTKPWDAIAVDSKVDTASSAKEAIQKSGLDWLVEKQPVFLYNNELIPNQYATVRDTDHKFYGFVSDRYKIVQNHEAFDFMDSLYNSGDINYDSVGVLGDGKKIALSVKLTEGMEILDDDFDIYMLLLNSHDGKGAIRACVTPVRLKCMNVLNLAMRKAVRSWSIQHTGNPQMRLAEAHDSIKLAVDFTMNLKQSAKFMADKKINDASFRKMLSQLYPIEEETKSAQRSNMLALREVTEEAYNASDIARFQGSAWGVINAVSDVVTHRSPIRNIPSFYEKRLEGILKGDKILDSAYDFLMAI